MEGEHKDRQSKFRAGLGETAWPTQPLVSHVRLGGVSCKEASREHRRVRSPSARQPVNTRTLSPSNLWSAVWRVTLRIVESRYWPSCAY